jgi:tetrapyrrole methylase family protein / MazG family protein
MNQNLRDFNTLVEIMAKLRAPGGCPWDQEQTHQSLAPYAIEEASELSEAIADHDISAVTEELGDLLLQVVFHGVVGREAGTFTIEDIIESISSKLIRRHPHVFGDIKVSSSDEVTENWEKIKAGEKAKKIRAGRMDVPLGMPALQRAQKIGDRTKKEKFDWGTPWQVFEKLKEEVNELQEEVSKLKMAPQVIPELKTRIQMEIGDVLFTAAQLCRHFKFDAEQTLRDANQKFERRYLHMRKLAEKSGRDWLALSDQEKEELWAQAKVELRPK